MRTYVKYYSRVPGRFVAAEPLASNFDEVVLKCWFSDDIVKNITISWNRILTALDEGILESRRIVDKYTVDY